ncbi:MAG: OadG family transporter subunit [Clostridiaceae bacterium]|nr:OadG family transporter subunit [Clostridiaceae bacterium]
MVFALSTAPWMEQHTTVSEQFFFGVAMALIGLVFAMMFILVISLVINAITRSARQQNRENTADAVPVAAGAAESGTVPGSFAVQAAVRTPAASAGNPALIAVLAAAISAFNAQAAQPSTAGFIIRRVRRV